MDTTNRKKRHTGSRSASAKGRSSASSSGQRRRNTQTRRAGASQQKRTVRPPREEIPEVVYTSPKPFNRTGFLLKLVSMVAVVAALVMCMSLFFRVETVMVSGAQVYSAWQIREASGIETGGSLLGLSRGGVAGRIKSQLPYVDMVKVSIELPGTVYIDITELDVAYAVEDSTGNWWLISADGRVIEPADASELLGYTRVQGVQVQSTAAGSAVEAAETQTEETDDGWKTEGNDGQNPQRLQVALSILKYLENNGIVGEVVSVDVSDLDELTMNYEGRITVVLGDSEQLSYKISYMAAAVKQLESYETGELDVSFRYSDQALLTKENQ